MENNNNSFSDEIGKLSFEDALKRLETNVAKMESGNLPLEKMMEAFVEGQTLAGVCTEKLKAVEKKIEILKKKSNGEGEWSNFDEVSAQTRNAPPPIQKNFIEDDNSSDDDLLF